LDDPLFVSEEKRKQFRNKSLVNFSLEAEDFVSLFNALDVEPILSLVFNWGNELDPLSLDLHSDDIWSGLNVAAAT
jgi:hypothetical protein